MRLTPLFICVVLCVSLFFPGQASCFAQEEAPDELIEMVVSLLHDEDKEMRALGLEQVRSAVKGEAATRRFASHLAELPPAAQVGLLSALADRGDAAARPAVLEVLAANAAEPVRVAAIEALGDLGAPADTRTLVQLFEEGSSAEATAARASLVRLPGNQVPREIVTQMKQATPAIHVSLIEILAIRRAIDSIPDFLSAAVDDDPLVRRAAMKALGQLAGPEHVSGMVRGVLKADRGRERDAAEKAISQVCARDERAGKRAEPLLAAYKMLDQAEQDELLPTLGRVGGPDALKIVATALTANSQRHAIGVRALCNWPDASIAPRLIELATSDEHPAHRITALRALIRVAPMRDERSHAERLDLLRTAMSMATRDAERILALDRARTVLDLEALHFVTPYLDQSRYAQHACQSVVELAHHRGLREPHREEFDQALDKVIQISKDPTVIDRAQRYKRGETWVRPARTSV